MGWDLVADVSFVRSTHTQSLINPNLFITYFYIFIGTISTKPNPLWTPFRTNYLMIDAHDVPSKLHRGAWHETQAF